MSAYLKDLAERVVASFAGGMAAVVGVTGADLTNGDVWIGGSLAGAVAVIRALAGRFVGSRDETSLLR